MWLFVSNHPQPVSFGEAPAPMWPWMSSCSRANYCPESIQPTGGGTAHNMKLLSPEGGDESTPSLFSLSRISFLKSTLISSHQSMTMSLLVETFGFLFIWFSCEISRFILNYTKLIINHAFFPFDYNALNLYLLLLSPQVKSMLSHFTSLLLR